jgi:hypothetical protein
VKFVPRHNQIIGRMVVRRAKSAIIVGDPTKVTKFVLVDAVGEGAAAAGVKVGDIIVPKSLSQIVTENGMSFCPFLEEKDVAFFVRDLLPGEMLIQSASGTQYVSLESPEAADAFGGQEEESKAAE